MRGVWGNYAIGDAKIKSGVFYTTFDFGADACEFPIFDPTYLYSKLSRLLLHLLFFNFDKLNFDFYWDFCWRALFMTSLLSFWVLSIFLPKFILEMPEDYYLISLDCI